MLIAIVEFQVAAKDHTAAFSVLLGETPTVRALPGCQNFRAFPDPNNLEQICILHEWDSEAEFSKYLNSPGFAKADALLRPIMTRAPTSRRFNAKIIETAP
ncbi:MAG: antibiotic biosynthesis monooxygenase [Marinosulfonomonas sp.]|nr:MAG: antibiotic biosynthesis monooxygenase [Marinosulfonomonas sp.]